jgi:transposase-like protein
MTSDINEYIRSDQKYDCHVCDGTFDNKKKFEDHMKINPRKYKCQNCRRVYVVKDDRDEHVKNGDCSKKIR